MRRITQYPKKRERDRGPLPDSPPGLCAAQAKGILITRPEKRTEQETLTIERLKRSERELEKCCRLFEGFARLFRQREEHIDGTGDEKARVLLQRWTVEAEESEIAELKAFAVSSFVKTWKR